MDDSKLYRYLREEGLSTHEAKLGIFLENYRMTHEARVEEWPVVEPEREPKPRKHYEKPISEKAFWKAMEEMKLMLEIINSPEAIEWDRKIAELRYGL